MSFSDDNGGFRFACEDAKFSISASTWNTRLSQLRKMQGELLILTRLLPDTDYLERILGKRPTGIRLVAHEDARTTAEHLKRVFPNIRVALSRTNNAKVVLVAPETVWLSSEDFGKSNHKIEAGVGFHSPQLFERVVASLFEPAWSGATEIR